MIDDASEGTRVGDTLSIVMPVYNGLHYLRRSLPPLLASQDAGLVEVLVVDDGSTDGSAEYARESGARVIPSGGRLGPAGARNVAVREVQGEVVLFVDADVVVQNDTVGRVIRAFTDPGVVAVFGSYDDAPSDRRFASRYMNLRHHYGHQRASEDAQTFWAGLGAVRRDAFLAVDGFDGQRYAVPSIEDIDLGRRLREAGGRIRLLPDIQAKHLKQWSLGGVIHTDIFCRGLPWARLMMEYPGAFTDLNVQASERIKAVIALSFVLSVVAAIIGLAPGWLPFVLFAAAATANRELMRVFARSSGWWVALRGILFHQLYYLYSGAVYVFSSVEHRIGASR
jgi:GT2 family glycosyltransferase